MSINDGVNITKKSSECVQSSNTATVDTCQYCINTDFFIFTDTDSKVYVSAVGGACPG